MKKILIVFLCLIMCGCENTKQNPKSNQLESIIEKNNYIIVDVRTEEEYNQGHVVNSINIPVDEIDENIELDKSKTILVYCQSGNRSGMAYNTLVSLGYVVYDLGAYSSINLPKE